VLVAIGEKYGLNTISLDAFLAGDEDRAAIYEENARAHRLGVNGVPAFAFSGNMVISGAQEAEVLVRVLDAANVEARAMSAGASTA